MLTREKLTYSIKVYAYYKISLCLREKQVHLFLLRS